MFDKTLIPQQNAQAKQALTTLFNSSGASADLKSIIDKKLDKIDNQMKDKIASTITISEYFNQLWTQPELRQEDKEFAIRKLESIQQNKKLQIEHGDQSVAKSCGNLDAINDAFKMTAFEEYNLQEKIEEFKKKNKLDIKVTLNISTHPDPEVLHALNKVSKSAKADTLHYTAGLANEEEEDHIKAAKAEDFVRKIQAEKKSFKQSMKEREMSVEKRELSDLERLKQKEKDDEEKRNKEKKDKLEVHIKELKHRNEQRQKESDKWEEEYRIYTAKKPLYKEYEDKYKKSVLMPELADRKKKLKEIRDFHKPIVREELDEHERKMTKALEEFNAKKELQLQKEVSDKNKPYKKPEFESKYHQKIVEEASKQRNGKEHEQSEKLKKKERMMEYLQQVKEKHQPTTDPAKELELLNMIEKIGKKDTRSKTADDEERHESHMELRKKGNDYLLAVKEQVQEQMKRKKEKMHTTKDGIEDQSQVTEKNILHSVKSDTTFRKRNYLADLRKENKLVAANQSSHVDSIIRNKKLDNSERKELLQTEVEKLEEKAKRLELLKKHKAKKQTDDDDTEVDQIYINAIRAKLEMLGN